MHLNIEHDETGQKFSAEVGGEECLLAYTMINDAMHLHFLLAPNEDIAEQLCMTAFEYAKKNGLKIISSSEYVDEFVKRHPEYHSLIEAE